MSDGHDFEAHPATKQGLRIASVSLKNNFNKEFHKFTLKFKTNMASMKMII